jgi:hypothetical protein
VGNDPYAVLTAIGVVFALSFVLRWVFRPSRPRPTTLPPDAAESPDLGLLTVIVSGVDRGEAMRRRAALGDAGIRSSMSRRRGGDFDVLVFRADAEAARIVLGP